MTYSMLSVGIADLILHSFLVERIASQNASCCPLSSVNAQKTKLTNSGKPLTYVNHNNSTGLWIQAPSINHGYMATVQHSFLGDMIIIRAARDLPPDTEVTIPYNRRYDDSYTEKQHRLKQWGFECSCTICIIDKRISLAAHAKSVENGNKLRQISGRPSIHTDAELAKAQRLIDEVDAMFPRPANQIPRSPDVWLLQLLLAQAYFHAGQPIDVLRLVKDVSTSLGFVIEGLDAITSNRFVVVKWGLVVEELLMVFMLARWAFIALKRKGEVTVMTDGYAKLVFKIFFGEDESDESDSS